MALLRFLASTPGRWFRGVLGVVVIVLAVVLAVTVSAWWWLLAVLGLVFLGAGAFDVCPLAVLAGKPVSGPKFRASA